MIGHVTSSNTQRLLRVGNLSVLETVDSAKLAQRLNDQLERQSAEDKTKQTDAAAVNAGAADATANAQPAAATQRQHDLAKEDRRRLSVFVQVNTSGEESKYGTDPAQVLELCRFIELKCPNLLLAGLMTIGKLGGDGTEDFKQLVQLRSVVCTELAIPLKYIELSMGMSGDFENAIRHGSTNVRVGSSIFGEREKKKD